MNIIKFEQEFKHLINQTVIKYNSKAYSKKYGNVSVHENEFNPSNFYYIEIDDKVYHINYNKQVELNKSVFKKGVSKSYGIITGNYLLEITEKHLIDNKFIDYTPVKDYKKKLEEKYFGEFENKHSNSLEKIEEKIDVCTKLENHFSKLLNLYRKKSQEYSTSSWDSNFIKGANILQTTKEEVLLGYATKHIVSIVDIIKGKPASIETISEKIGDIQIYLALLQIMYEEKNS